MSRLRQSNSTEGDTSLPLFDSLEAERAKRNRRSKDRVAVAQPDFLDLPSLRILSVSEKDYQYEVEAEPASRPAHCPGCGAQGKKLHRHDSRLQYVKDVLVREKRVLIHLHRDRFKCSKCGQLIQLPLEGIDHRRGVTSRLLGRVEVECLDPYETFRKIARRYDVDERRVRKIFTQLIRRLSRSWRFDAPRCLGIDEVYIEGAARCVLTDVENRRLINILPQRNALTLRRHLLQIKHPERIRIVVIDMWRPYYDEVRKRFPNAIIVIDKFHVLRMATAAVISVRRRLRRGDKNLRLPKVHLLRKRKHKLPEGRLKDLEDKLDGLPDLKQAHAVKEAFLNIWNSLNRQDAEQRINKWVNDIPAHLRDDFKDLRTALENWRNEILNYFDHRVTNAFTESINGVIKHMQRLGRGYTYEVTRAKLIYGGPFSTQGSRTLAGGGGNPSRVDGTPKSKKKSRRPNAPPNPRANVQQLKRIRHSEDEFNELTRPPAGYVERFKHFNQMDFNF